MSKSRPTKYPKNRTVTFGTTEPGAHSLLERFRSDRAALAAPPAADVSLPARVLVWVAA